MPMACEIPCGHPWCEEACRPDYTARYNADRYAYERMSEAVASIVADLDVYWEMGGGTGDAFLHSLSEAVREAGHRWPGDPYPEEFRSKRKQKIGRGLSRQVMERDGYRCIACATHLNLSCDHIIPESKGGPTTLDNLQTMCRSCNSSKGARL